MLGVDTTHEHSPALAALLALWLWQLPRSTEPADGKCLLPARALANHWVVHALRQIR